MGAPGDSAEEARRALDAFFNRFDGDMNDEVDRAEMERMLAAEGVDGETCAAAAGLVFDNWDSDGSGTITISEAMDLADKWASFSGDAT